MIGQKSDIVIIGAGIAGLVAAHECLEHGKSVTIVDRHDAENVGGLARTAFGGMALVGTPLQRRMGIKDSGALALSDWCSFAEFGDADMWPRKWAEAYVEQSADKVFHWLRDKGMRFLPAVNWVERGNFIPGNSVPRYHILWGTGLGLVERFVELLKAHRNSDKLRYVFGCRVDDLVVDNGRVAGCRGVIETTGEQREFLGDQTMVATGGINGNLQKVRDNWYWGNAPADLLNGSHPYCNGAMHDVVEQKGGIVTHLENMWNYAAGIPHPFPQFDGHGLSLIPCKSALWLDHTGNRIGPEPLVSGFDTNDMCGRLSALEKPWSWQVLNWRIAAKEFAISGAEHNPHIRDSRTLPFLKETLLGNHRLVRQMQEESDHFIVADTLPELVAAMNALNGDELVKLNNVAQAIGAFDDNVRRGPGQWNDDQIRRIVHARAWRSDRIRTCKPKPLLDHGPLIAMKLRLITRKSLGGIQTDLRSRALDTHGNPIAGLYAIGEAAGFGGWRCQRQALTGRDVPVGMHSDGAGRRRFAWLKRPSAFLPELRGPASEQVQSANREDLCSGHRRAKAMKLRIRGDSIRLRLKRGEVAQLAAGEVLVDRTHFPGSVFSYRLELSDGDDMRASFADGNLQISMPREIIPEWADTDLVSLYSEQDLPDGKLALLVEKDFTCLEPGHHRDCDDDADTYPHPSA